MFRINRKYLKTFDWPLLCIVILISAIGIMTLYSATRPVLTPVQPNYYIKQIVWLSIGMGTLLVFVLFDYRLLYKIAYPLYILGIILLVLVYLGGKTGMGAQRWLDIGIISFQPSEIVRVFLIVGISRFLSSYKERLTRSAFILSLVLFGLIPFVLLVKQPDLGTGVVMLSLFFLLVLSKGMDKRFIITLIILSLVIIPISGKKIWEGLRDYQKNRIIAFVDHSVDPQGIGYQIEQSKITIGSGMLLGKGYLKGTQGPLRFLPEKHTDFVFPVFAEEWGFAGSLIVFFLYLLLFLRGIDTALKAKDDFGRHTAIGITYMIFLYFMINVGMVLGMMPVIGKPIPFMSYGGTALVSNFIAVGILINIRMRRLGLFY